MHVSERSKASNTARVLQMTLPNCQLFELGALDTRFEGVELSQDEATYVLYPEPSASALTPEFVTQQLSVSKKKIHLIVPDGSWTQAKRIAHHNPHLRGIPRLQLQGLAPSDYQLRRNGRTGGVCTLEAVAHALGIIEGERTMNELLANFYIMRDSVLSGRSRRRGGPLVAVG